MTVIQLLAGYPILTQIQSTFREEVEKYFSPMKNHPAVMFIRNHWKNGVAYEKPVFMVLLLGQNLKPEFSLPQRVEESIGGKLVYDEFAVKFADFYLSKEFQEFLSAKKVFYRDLVMKIAPVIEQTQAAGQLVSYYGYKKGGFRIVLSPLLHGGGFGPSIQTSASAFVTCSIMGPVSWSPATGFEFGDTNRFNYLIWHEFSHSYLNPIIDRNQEELNQYSSLFEPIRDEMEKNAYGVWTTCLYEHLVRAATVRLVSLHISGEQGGRDMQTEISREFIYIPGIIDAFKYYEMHRDQYRKIDDLYPILLQVIREYSEGSRIARKSDRIEYIQSVRGDEDRFIQTGYPNVNFTAKNIKRNNGYVILPTHETDKEAQELIVKNASDIPAIQDINHGGQCYLISRGLEVLEEGFFWIENNQVIPKKK